MKNLCDITSEIIDYYYNYTELGLREVALGLEFKTIILTSDFPYYDCGIRMIRKGLNDNYFHSVDLYYFKCLNGEYNFGSDFNHYLVICSNEKNLKLSIPYHPNIYVNEDLDLSNQVMYLEDNYSISGPDFNSYQYLTLYNSGINFGLSSYSVNYYLDSSLSIEESLNDISKLFLGHKNKGLYLLSSNINAVNEVWLYVYYYDLEYLKELLMMFKKSYPHITLLIILRELDIDVRMKIDLYRATKQHILYYHKFSFLRKHENKFESIRLSYRLS